MKVSVACVVAAVAMAVRPAAEPAQPTFSARTEGVRVDVLVADGARRPVRGLQTSDFEIRDNGVLQTVDSVSYGDLPLSIALAFDLSESVAGERLSHLRAASAALTRSLASSDTVALVTFGTGVTMPCPMSIDASCVLRHLETVVPQGDTALVDGVFAGMMVGESHPGRNLLMVFSDGLDTASWLPSSRLLDVARRSDAVAYVAAVRGARPPFLQELATVTGGRLFETHRTQDLIRTFRDILDEFRQRYLVTFTPRGVARSGWHALDVRVPARRVSVRARPGYQGF